MLTRARAGFCEDPSTPHIFILKTPISSNFLTFSLASNKFRPEPRLDTMGKARMNLLDVSAICGELQRLVGLRVANIYNLDGKTFVFKLAGW